jgi:hypothetical protein
VASRLRLHLGNWGGGGGKCVLVATIGGSSAEENHCSIAPAVGSKSDGHNTVVNEGDFAAIEDRSIVADNFCSSGEVGGALVHL